MQEKNLTIWKSGFKRFLSILSWIILVILIAIALFLAYVGLSTKISNANGNAKKPVFSLYTIVSGSMEPNINIYDIVLNSRVDDVSTIKSGDVITFISTSSQSAGKTVTHRVIDIITNEDGSIVFQTKGDNNELPDSAYVDASHIIGKKVVVIPQLGRIQFLLARKGAWLLLIAIPCLFMLFKYIIKLIKLIKMKDNVETTINKYDEDDNNGNKIDFTNNQ